MPLPIIAGIVIRAAVGYAAKQGIKYATKKAAKKAIKKLMSKAQDKAEKVLAKEAKRRKSCKTCKALDKLKDPCSFLRKGNPAGTGKYRGGSYGGAPGSKAKKLESHHIPAESAYGLRSMSQSKMPAIQMDVADHRKTSSWGSSANAKAYRRLQKTAMKSKGGIAAGFAMDLVDIKLRFGKKYDTALIEAGAYLACISKYPAKYPK